jgi:hypothetical protein
MLDQFGLKRRISFVLIEAIRPIGTSGTGIYAYQFTGGSARDLSAR